MALPPGTLASLVHWQLESADSSVSCRRRSSSWRRSSNDGSAPGGAVRRTECSGGRSGRSLGGSSRRILLLDTPPSDDQPGPVPRTPMSQLVSVNALLAGLAIGDEQSEAAAVATGFQFGVDFARGASLHHTVRAVTVLVGWSCDRSRRRGGDDVRRKRRGRNLAGSTAPRSLGAPFPRSDSRLHAGRGLRDRFRHLRHDLRNRIEGSGTDG